MKGITFPAEKKDIITAVQNNGASAETMYFLKQITDKTYILPSDVDEEFSLTIQE